MQKSPVLLSQEECPCCSECRRPLPSAQPACPRAAPTGAPTPKFNTAPATASKHLPWRTPQSPTSCPSTSTTVPSKATPPRDVPLHVAFSHAPQPARLSPAWVSTFLSLIFPGKIAVQSAESYRTAQHLCRLPESLLTSSTVTHRLELLLAV